jgi:hypothetical protein
VDKVDLLFEIMESEATDRYFFDRPLELFQASKPAVIITTGPFVAPDAKKNEFYTVWFDGLEHWNFKGHRLAVTFVEKSILLKLPSRVTVRRERRNG